MNFKNTTPQSAVIILVLTALAIGCSPKNGSNITEKKLSTPEAFILDESALLSDVDPCDDFYQFSCGNWLNNTDIPSGKTSTYRSMSPIIDGTQAKLNDLLSRLSEGDPSLKGSASSQLADFYSSCMNYDKNVAPSEEILREKISEINRIGNTRDLARVLARLHLSGVDSFFALGAYSDPGNSTKMLATLSQAGMAFYEPSYYLDKDKETLEMRERYLEHIALLNQLFGDSQDVSKKNAEISLSLETQLASEAYSREKDIDPSKTYHPMTLEALKEVVPHFDWESYFAELQVNESRFNLQEPEFFQKFDKIMLEFSMEDIKKYLKWTLIHSLGAHASPNVENENFRFWKKYLNGIKEAEPRWETCTKMVKDGLGYALAEVYVGTIDSSAVRIKAKEMIEQVKQSFLENLDSLTSGQDAWLDRETKSAAMKKLKLMKEKVGAPDKWEDYSLLKTSKSSFLLNQIHVNTFALRNNLAQLGRPVDPSRWSLMPWVVSAQYGFSSNEFTIPFGILQVPMFDLTASDGANFGPIGGGTIGHELMHGFDNNGRQMDADGNLKDWWTKDTLQAFKSRAECFVEQANHYTIAEVGMTVNGELTLSENLADQGGVKLGYDALLKAQFRMGRKAGLWINKYTENQQYWIAYAQSWCTKMTSESLRGLMTTNEHPPAEFRVNGVLMNRPEFAKDFKCAEGARMVPAKRCSLW